MMTKLLKMMFASYNEEQKTSFLINAGQEAFSNRPSPYARQHMRMALATWYNAEIKESGFMIDMSASHQVVILNSNREMWINYDEAEETLIELYNAAVNANENNLRKIWEMME